MTLDEIRDALVIAGLDIKNEIRLSNNTGNQIRLMNGAIVNYYDNGNYSLQGKNQDVVKNALSYTTTKGITSIKKT
jgi:predicted nucleotide-binding protein